MKIERNAPCPCGSGKKYKKCHLGKEDELGFEGPEEIPEDVSGKITALPPVTVGRSREILAGTDIKALTGSPVNIKLIDLKAYSAINSVGGMSSSEKQPGGGSVFVNIHKTEKADPDNIYIAVSPDAGESVLVHQVAHVLDYLNGSGLMPGMGKALSMELEVPVEHLEHSMEFGKWFESLRKKFNVQLDADDTIILYLYSHAKLLEGEEIKNGDYALLKEKSREILAFLSRNGPEINELIRERSGYIGSQLNKD
jgi:hypothetical protein